jgi:tetratricopeptide (TPR) repeat protein
LWFPIALGPVLNIVPLEMTIAERWLYVPMIGVLAAASMVVVPLVLRLRPRLRNAAWLGVVVVVGFLSARTILRNRDWKDEMSLYGTDIRIVSRISPQGSYELENYYGMALFRTGRIDEAGEYFRRSIALQPNWMYSRNNLGAVLERQKDFEGALEEYRRSIAAGDYYLAYENVGAVLLQMKRYDEAKAFLEAAITKFPRNSKLKLELALLYADNISRDPAALRMAMEWTSLALEDDPLNAQARQLQALLQNARGF